jgi:histone H3/H4
MPSRKYRYDLFVTSPEWKRIAQKAGVDRISLGCLLWFDKIANKFIETSIKTALFHTTHANRKTIQIGDISKAINTLGYSSKVIFPCNPTKCTISHAKNISTRIRSYQNQTNCLFIAREGFRSIVKLWIKYFDKNNIRISAEALTALQIALENFFISLIEAAHASSQTKTLLYKDIKLIMDISYQNLA